MEDSVFNRTNENSLMPTDLGCTAKNVNDISTRCFRRLHHFVNSTPLRPHGLGPAGVQHAPVNKGNSALLSFVSDCAPSSFMSIARSQSTFNMTNLSCAHTNKQPLTPRVGRRSLSTGNLKPSRCKALAPALDRFIPRRDQMDMDRCCFLMSNKENSIISSNCHDILDERTIAKRQLLRVNESVLKFHKPPVEPSVDGLIRRWNEWSGCVENAQLLQIAQGKHYRPIRKVSERVLDAPDARDDFYMQILDWSFNDTIGIALDTKVYIWNAQTQKTTCLCPTRLDNYIFYSSIAFHSNRNIIACNSSEDILELYDYGQIDQIKNVRLESRATCVDWSRNLLICGLMSGSLWLHDLNCSQSKIAHIPFAHSDKVCGVKWSPCRRYIATGGNDNRVHIWDYRNLRGAGACKGPVKPFMSLPERAHKSAIKAIAWCPWKNGVLATGGGTSCRSIRLTNIFNGNSLARVKDTGSQVMGLLWSEKHRELLSSHGLEKCQLTIWRCFPTAIVRVCELAEHRDRIVGLAQSPNKETVVSASCDETLRFWNCFEGEPRWKSSTVPNGVMNEMNNNEFDIDDKDQWTNLDQKRTRTVNNTFSTLHSSLYSGFR